MISNDTKQRVSYLYVKHLKKNPDYFERRGSLALANSVISERMESEEESQLGQAHPELQKIQGGLNFKEEIQKNLQLGTIRKERRHSYENYELLAKGSDKSEATIQHIVSMSKATKFSKVLLQKQAPRSKASKPSLHVIHEKSELHDEAASPLKEEQEDCSPSLVDNYPYVLEDFGVLQLQEYVDVAQLATGFSQKSGVPYMQLFTVDAGDAKDVKLTVYKIKRLYQSQGSINKEKFKREKELLDKQQHYLKQLNKGNLDQSSHNLVQQKLKQLLAKYSGAGYSGRSIQYKSTYRLLSFRLSKYSTVKLDYRPVSIQFYDPYFILNYGGGAGPPEHQGERDAALMRNQENGGCTIPFIDIFEKTGEPVRRINVGSILREHNLTFKNVSHVLVPQLQWSTRQNLESELRDVVQRNLKEQQRKQAQKKSAALQSKAPTTNNSAKGVDSASEEGTDSEEEELMKLNSKGKKHHSLLQFSRLVIVGECQLGLEEQLNPQLFYQSQDGDREMGVSSDYAFEPSQRFTCDNPDISVVNQAHINSVTYPYMMTLNCSESENVLRSKMGLQSSYLHSPGANSSKGFQLVSRSHPPQPEIIKVINLPVIENKALEDLIQSDPLCSSLIVPMLGYINNVITQVGFGPYDNGYLTLGSLSGHLLTYDSVSLTRVNCEQVFKPSREVPHAISTLQHQVSQSLKMVQDDFVFANDEEDKGEESSLKSRLRDQVVQELLKNQVTQIQFDPLHMILVGNLQGTLKSLNSIKQEV
mmetsp:Transcript_12763/g.21552  ORF Transcript_12763/g.21552 Transcript_12763/m.21552 type:complete len:759 (-) Transcript_12763:196-2472(-)